MTREEAREILTHNWTRVDNPNYSESELDEAFFMAIEALSADAEQVASKLKNPCDSLLTDESADCKESGSKLESVANLKEEFGSAETHEIRMETHECVKETHDTDLISRADAIEAVRLETGKLGRGLLGKGDILDIISALPSADAVPSEQYKKGFEDAKRAFLVEYARESKNMRKRNAQLEVMLNAQKAMSVDAVQVVRCKDCRYQIKEKGIMWCSHEDGVCGDAPDNFYCAYGEKEDE